MKLSSIGERAVINNLLSIIRKSFPISDVPLGDDAAAVKFGDQWLILKIDGSSANTSKYEFMDWYDFGWRIASSAVSDVVAKGGFPLGIVSSIGIPADYDDSIIYDIISGVTDFASTLNSYVLGGDVNESLNDVWLDIAVLGTARKFIPAVGLQAGDYLHVTGCLGLSAIPYILHFKKVDPTPWMDVLKSIWRSVPPLDFLKIASNVKASTDISDGLASISRVLSLSNVGLEIDEFPLCSKCVEFAEELNIDLSNFIKFLGEEFQIVFTFGDGLIDPRYPRLGRIVKGNGIVIKGEKVDFGWEYFRGYH
ncbi:MAG: thiamine-phosphate kinase [Sulfolobales archaeon]|nr:thiamine-phosphate kinase [Sulfolobales archaeon]MDW7969324.1 thiamine-phosphate kinase [Sulfolobales archaeon]